MSNIATGGMKCLTCNKMRKWRSKLAFAIIQKYEQERENDPGATIDYTPQQEKQPPQPLQDGGQPSPRRQRQSYVSAII